MDSRGGNVTMSKAYILIETEVGKTREAYGALTAKKIKEIRSVDVVTGPYDIIVVVDHDDINGIGALVTEEIHPIPGIARTVTCLGVRLTQ